MPKSFLWRATLILFLPIFLLQFSSGYIFFDRHWEPITRYLSSGIAHRIITGCSWLESKTDTNADVVLLEELLGFKIKRVEQPRKFDKTHYHPFQSRFERSLNALVKKPYVLRMRARLTYVWVHCSFGWLEFQFPTKWLLSRSSLWWGVWSLGLTLFFSLLAAFFMYRQLLPLSRLARFAKKIETGQEIKSFSMRGARELRQIGSTLQQVYEKLWTASEDRKVMMIALSQDLKQTLSRLKLQINLLSMNDREKETLRESVQQMEVIVTSYACFAETGRMGTSSQISLLNFWMSILKEFPENERKKITLSVPKKSFVKVDPIFFKRVCEALIKNACFYSKNKVVVHVSIQNGMCYLIVADDGSGVAPESYEKIFYPFVRLNTNTSGLASGIGLAIVANFARLSGGSVKASSDKDLGGLCVQLSFPQVSSV